MGEGARIMLPELTPVHSSSQVVLFLCVLNQALRWDLGVLSRFVFPTALFRIPSECSPSFHS